MVEPTIPNNLIIFPVAKSVLLTCCPIKSLRTKYLKSTNCDVVLEIKELILKSKSLELRAVRAHLPSISACY